MAQGFLHGAWYEGRDAGQELAGCIKGDGCVNVRKHSEEVKNARPYQVYDYSTSSPWRDLDISVVTSILNPFLSWAFGFGREHVKTLFVAISLVYHLHQLIEGSWAHEIRLNLTIFS